MRHRVGDIVRASKEFVESGSYGLCNMKLKGIEGEIVERDSYEYDWFIKWDIDSYIEYFNEKNLRLVRRP